MFAALPPAPPAAAVASATSADAQYVVRRGETIMGIASRHGVSWTALLRANRLQQNDIIRVGDRLTIPGAAATAAAPRAAVAAPTAVPSTGASRQQVRQAIVDAAHAHGVDADLALAIGWQESRWRQNVVSHAGARGAMQCMPSTGEWMSTKAGRPLNLADVRDNATCGVLLLKTLQRSAGDDTTAIAAYYQGLAAVRAHGQYADTQRYVASVVDHRARLAAGQALRD